MSDDQCVFADENRRRCRNKPVESYFKDHNHVMCAKHAKEHLKWLKKKNADIVWMVEQMMDSK